MTIIYYDENRKKPVKYNDVKDVVGNEFRDKYFEEIIKEAQTIQLKTTTTTTTQNGEDKKNGENRENREKVKNSSGM